MRIELDSPARGAERPGSSRWQRFRRWVGKALLKDAWRGQGTMHANQTSPIDVQPTALSQVIDQVVDKAVLQANDEAKFEAESGYNSVLPPPLPLGPQRYRNPAVWNPDPRLKEPMGSERRQEAEKSPLDLTSDKHYSEVLELLDELERRSDA